MAHQLYKSHYIILQNQVSLPTYHQQIYSFKDDCRFRYRTFPVLHRSGTVQSEGEGPRNFGGAYSRPCVRPHHDGPHHQRRHHRFHGDLHRLFDPIHPLHPPLPRRHPGQGSHWTPSPAASGSSQPHLDHHSCLINIFLIFIVPLIY